MDNNSIWFYLLALLAEVIGTIGGFGSSLLFVPLAGFFFEFHQVLGITALFHVVSNISKITLFRSGFDKDLILKLGIPAVLFVSLGAYLSKFFDTKWLEIALAIMLITLSILLYFNRKNPLKPSNTLTITGGALSGFLAGLLGTGGAIRGITLASFHLKAEKFIATSAFIDFGVDLSRSIVYYFNDFIVKDILIHIPILIVISFLGTWIGKQILSKMSESNFQNFVLILIFITGLVTLVNQLK